MSEQNPPPPQITDGTAPPTFFNFGVHLDPDTLIRAHFQVEDDGSYRTSVLQFGATIPRVDIFARRPEMERLHRLIGQHLGQLDEWERARAAVPITVSCCTVTFTTRDAADQHEAEHTAQHAAVAAPKLTIEAGQTGRYVLGHYEGDRPHCVIDRGADGTGTRPMYEFDREEDARACIRDLEGDEVLRQAVAEAAAERERTPAAPAGPEDVASGASEKGAEFVHFSLLIPERIVCGAAAGAAVSMPEQGVTCPACVDWIRGHLAGYADFSSPEQVDTEHAAQEPAVAFLLPGETLTPQEIEILREATRRDRDASESGEEG